MNSSIYRNRLFVVFAALLVVTLACGIGGGGTGGDATATTDTGGGGPDLAGTAAALQATANALASQAAGGPPATEEVGGDFNYCGASGDTVFSTQFDVAGDWEEGWIHFPIPEGRDDYEIFVDNGYLYFNVAVANTTVYAVYDPIFFPRDCADVRVDASIDNVGQVRTNNISLICRGNDEGWYEFSLGSDGLWYIWLYESASNDYTLRANGGVQNYNKNITQHELSATCIGDTMTFYIDGVQPRGAQITDTQFREGQVAISVSTFDPTPVEVEVDWFEVSIP